jgi:insulysin
VSFASALLAFGSSASFKRVIDDIQKPKRDDRTYRGLELENGLKALVISDPKTDIASAALQVDIGFLSDPWDVQGLAHFCEHMLFLGTEKYPDENEYSKFITQHGGYVNAFTNLQSTTYFFTVNPDNLNGAIDRFSQFFISPLLNESSVEREVNAVNSEFLLGSKDDNRRIFHVQQTLAKKGHAFKKFGVGNRQTLYVGPEKKGLDPREEVLKFHEKWYSSNIMQLAIIGKESVEQLSELVLKYFSEIKNKNVKEPSWDIPYGKTEVDRFIKVETIKEKNDLELQFPIPDMYKYFDSKPASYISYVLGDEGVGSLASYYKRKGWVESFNTGLSSYARGFGTTDATAQLTKEGKKHQNEIIATFFQYINMMKELGPQKRLYDEAKKMAEINFQNSDKTDPIQAVMDAVENLRFYPISQVLSVNYLMPKYDPQAITSFLSYIRPNNLIIFRYSKTFDKKPELSDEWYETKYSVAPITPTLMDLIKKAGTNPKLKLPPPNDFIPSDISLRARDAKNGKLPELVISDDMMQVFFHQDKKYLVPKAYTFIKLTSPYANLSPLNSKLTSLFASLLGDSLLESLWPASAAGLHYSVSSSTHGILLSVNGYTEKQGLLVKQLMDKLVSFDPDPLRFVALRDQMVRSINNFNLSRGIGQAFQHMSTLTREKTWTMEQIKQDLDEITMDRLKKFIPLLLSELHVSIFGSGNLVIDDVKKVADTVRSVLMKNASTAAFDIDALTRQRAVRLIKGHNNIFQTEHPVAPDTAVTIYTQSNETTLHNTLKGGLLANIFQEPIFNTLRTKQQLGYVVGDGASSGGGVNGIYIYIQSSKPPNFLNDRIDEFLKKMATKLNDMSQEEFVRHRKAFATKRFEKPKQLGWKSGQLWSEIASREFNFDRREQEKAILKNITKSDIIEYFKAFVDPSNPDRRRVSSYVLGSKAKVAGYKMEDVCKGDKVECLSKGDEATFINQHQLYSYPKPFKTIKQLEAECPRGCTNKA